MILMDVKYLNYVLTIASEHNLHRAAEKLYISQPSLSQFLTKLEAEVGTPLFERRSKDLLLTEAGRLYVETAQTVIGLRNKLYRDISNLIYQNHLSIATTSQWGMRLISHVLPAFNQNHPDVMVEITESFFPSMARRLQNREVDICLASIVHLETDYEIIPLGLEEIYLTIPSQHPFCQQHNPDHTCISGEMLLNAFPDSPFLLTTKGSSTQVLIETRFRELHFHPRILGYFDNINTILHMVEDNTGMAFTPASCVVFNPNICYYHLDPPVCRKHIIAYRKDLTISPVVGDLLRTIRETYSNLMPT
jgi:DNA-binding transcriptional LysR family regulator